jgi:hypothetical protein
MTDFISHFDSSTVQIECSHLAFNHATATPQALSRRSDALSGVKAIGSPADPPRNARTSHLTQAFGGACLFERILLTPQSVAVGAVLTTVTILVDIWNTFRNVEQSLTGLILTGPGSAIVDLPPLPLVFEPLGSLLQRVVLPTVGDPVIDETVDFVFPGFDGTTLMLLGGYRLAVLSVEPNWGDDGIAEKPQLWMTDVMKAYSDSEQRVQLRSIPRSQVKFRITPDQLAKAYLDALLWGWQSQAQGVPFWPDAQPLLVTVTPGASILRFDTTDREFASDGLMMLWRDAFTFEVASITGLVTGGVQLGGGINNSWAGDGRTLCVPLRRGRLADMQDVTRTTSTIAELELTFDCEVV